ncbi:glycine zipper 2TM domain-containing protein [Marinicella rhabdoformis]|uniref:glycine zipper 2TM domain-containing protein n=1 Tax=Marinicella rhabdoformis TaxID=2580566 RepID=UPI0015D0BA26|nr:glycine zipper 2TM domain-containing protein [Marinicella rhabdoformis]
MKNTCLMLSLVLSGVALAGRYNDVIYVDVIDAQPIIETISVPESREICERMPLDKRYSKKHKGGSILGGIIGGAIGNKFGRGSGRDAATIAGVMIGASVGAQKDKARNRYHEVETRCFIDTVYVEEEQLIGYDVSYRYNGELRYIEMAEYPGDQIKLRLNVSVIE